jgi:hypothetical protein
MSHVGPRRRRTTLPEWNRRRWSRQPSMVLVLCLRAIFLPTYLRVTTGPQESGLMMLTTRFLTTPMPRVTLEVAAVRSVLPPRPVGAATTAVVRTIEMQKLGRELS